MDKRVAKTKRALRQALLAELQEKPMARITVAGLCRTAGIDRRTFYIHYAKVADVFTDYELEMRAAVSSAMSGRQSDPKLVLSAMDRILLANFDFFQYVCQNDSQLSLVVACEKLLFEAFCDGQTQQLNANLRMTLQFLAGGLIANYVYWFNEPDLLSHEALTVKNVQLMQLVLPKQ